MKLTLTRFPATLAFSALCMLLICNPAGAQTKKEWAVRAALLQQPTLEAMAVGMASQTAQQMLQAAGQAMAKVPAAKREALGKEVQGDIRRFYDELAPTLRDRALKLAPTTLGPLLEEKLSEEELKQLVAWLESPAAKKFSAMGPDLINAMQKALIADTRGTVEPKIHALEESLSKKMGIAPAPAASSSAAAASSPKPAKAPAKN